MKKLSLILALLMVLSLVAFTAGCAKDDPGSNSTGGTGDETKGDELGPDGLPYDRLPELNYNNTVVNFLVRDKYKERVYVENETADIINDSVYYRNRSVEERLGIKFNFVPVTSGNN